MKKCALPDCQNQFDPKPYWMRFCGPKHRDHWHYLRKKGKALKSQARPIETPPSADSKAA